MVDIKTRNKLGPNQSGELCIKGPIIMKGYINNETASREIMDEEGFLKTGDIGYYDPEGSFFLVDRLRELIKYKGYEVTPISITFYTSYIYSRILQVVIFKIKSHR